MTSDTIDYFMSQPDGANYVVLYQMLCLKTINTDGRLSRKIGEIIIPFDVEKIQRDCKWFSIDTIRVALNLYRQVGLVYEDVDGTLVMTDHDNLVGSETDAAARMRTSRANRNAHLPPAVTNGEQSAHILTPDIRDRDKRLDNRGKILDSDIEKEVKECSTFVPPSLPIDHPKTVRHKHGQYGWVKLTDMEYQQLLYDLGQKELKRCIAYIDESAQSNKNKNKWSDWDLIIRRCSRDGWGLRNQQTTTAATSGSAMTALQQLHEMFGDEGA